MKRLMIVLVACGCLAGCSYTPLASDPLRQPSSWTWSQKHDKPGPLVFSQHSRAHKWVRFHDDAQWCDDIADRWAVARNPLDDPDVAGPSNKQRRQDADVGFFRCMYSVGWKMNNTGYRSIVVARANEGIQWFTPADGERFIIISGGLKSDFVEEQQ